MSQLLTADAVIRYRLNHDDRATMKKVAGITTINESKQLNVDDRFEAEFDLTSLPCPEMLSFLYMSTQMDRDVLSQHFLAKKDKKHGASASTWEFKHLVDLCCVPVFGVGIDAIIPRYTDIEQIVREKVDNCYSRTGLESSALD